MFLVCSHTVKVLTCQCLLVSDTTYACPTFEITRLSTSYVTEIFSTNNSSSAMRFGPLMTHVLKSMQVFHHSYEATVPSFCYCEVCMNEYLYKQIL